MLMLIKRCDFCGGELEINEDMSVGICKYCDSINMIPKNLGRKGELYNRAVFLRQSKEFDKALDVYEEILKEDNSDADAHWGLVLSKYGIEYVHDDKTGKRIPTCHRTQADPILSDPDYLAAIEYADIEAKRLIEAEAKKISAIQRRILEISKSEPPYDVFICYKETDESGERTKDSILAQELYYELEKKNYKVFFARKTLESKLGTEYEPVIFSALNTAKIMIVVGTKAEYFNAVWVRNEWSRFLKMSHKSSKVIIPAYSGISPYELPDELSALQSQDMSKLGFMQDLTDGIDKILRKNHAVNDSPTQAGRSTENSMGSLGRLLQNCETYLALKDYERAKDVYTRITEEYPESHQGWWGLIVCATKDFNVLAENQKDIEVWFGYVEKLASSEVFEGLKGQYVGYLRIVAENDAKQDVLNAQGMINKLNKEVSDRNDIILGYRQEIRTNKAKAEKETSVVGREISDITISASEGASKKGLQKIAGILLLVAGIAVSGFAVLLVCDMIINDYKGVLWLLGWGFVIAVALGAMFLLASGADYMGKVSDHERKINEGNKKISDLEKQKETINNKWGAVNKKVLGQINNIDQEIKEINKQISACTEYTNLPEEQIAAFFYANKLKDFGVEHTYDEKIQELREKVFGLNAVSANIKQDNSGATEKAAGITVGRVYSATVTRIMSFGAFVKIDKFDWDGLIHISKLSPDKNIRVERVEDAVSIGDTVDVLVEQIHAQGQVDCALVDSK